ncbi:hypothetical protein PMHK_16050 [Pseudomonas sp. MHK4]
MPLWGNLNQASIGTEWRNKPYAQCTDIAGLRVEPDRFADPAKPGVVLPGKVSAGNVLEVYENSGKVFIDELYLLASNLLLSSFKRAIQKCI